MNIKRIVSPWWLLAAIALVAIVFPYAGRYLRQAIVAYEFRSNVTSISQSGYPVDVDSLLQRLRETTSDENTVAWMEWMYIAFEIREASFSAGLLSYENNELVIPTPSPDKPWPDEPILNALLKQSKAAYERLKELSRQDGKVWLPILFGCNRRSAGWIWHLAESG